MGEWDDWKGFVNVFGTPRGARQVNTGQQNTGFGEKILGSPDKRRSPLQGHPGRVLFQNRLTYTLREEEKGRHLWIWRDIRRTKDLRSILCVPQSFSIFDKLRSSFHPPNSSRNTASKKLCIRSQLRRYTSESTASNDWEKSASLWQRKLFNKVTGLNYWIPSLQTVQANRLT